MDGIAYICGLEWYFSSVKRVANEVGSYREELCGIFQAAIFDKTLYC